MLWGGAWPARMHSHEPYSPTDARTLTHTYTPARTHTRPPIAGAWGLDDYQFLCFLWGSAQLIGACLRACVSTRAWCADVHMRPLACVLFSLLLLGSEYSPDCISDAKLMEREGGDMLYFAAILFVNQASATSHHYHQPPRASRLPAAGYHRAPHLTAPCSHACRSNPVRLERTPPC